MNMGNSMTQINSGFNLWRVDLDWVPGHTYHTALSLSSSSGQGMETMMKSLWVEIRTGLDTSPTTVTGKTDST